MCPNCGGDVSEDRLRYGLPCKACLSDAAAEGLKLQFGELDPSSFREKVAEALQAEGKLKNYGDVVRLDREVSRFSSFFKQVTGFDPWRSQESWARRALSGESFALISPPGVGKSVFSAVMALYMAMAGKKVLFLTPTALLASQTSSRLRLLSSRAGGVPVSELTSLAKGGAQDAPIVVTTSVGLRVRFNSLKGRFDAAFLDDADSMLRSSKNVERLLMALGYSEGTVEGAFKLSLARSRALRKARSEPEEARRALREMEEQGALAEKRPAQVIFTSATAKTSGRGAMIFSSLLGMEVQGGMGGIRNVVDVALDPSSLGSPSPAEDLREDPDEGRQEGGREGDRGGEQEGQLEGTREEGGGRAGEEGSSGRPGGPPNPPQEALAAAAVSEVRRLGKGGLVFVSHDLGQTYAKELARKLTSAGLPSSYVEGKRAPSTVSKLVNGELHALVGMAGYYGPLVRGLDLPSSVRYALFVGVPKFMFKITSSETNPLRLSQLLWEISYSVSGEELVRARRLSSTLRRMARPLGREELRRLEEALRQGRELEGYLGEMQKQVKGAQELLAGLLNRRDVVESLKASPRMVVRERQGSLYLVIPDFMTYLQASGRTSRMGPEGMTTGLSEVVVDDWAAMAALEKSARLYFHEMSFLRPRDVEWDALLRRLEADRAGGGGVRPKGPALMIVESPNKARTISGFYGKATRKTVGDLTAYEVNMGGRSLTVAATGGHLFDLPAEETEGYGVVDLDGTYLPVLAPIKKCMVCGTTFTEGSSCPSCGSTLIRDASRTVSSLRKLASEADMVYVCTDPDVEGERIAWDVTMMLRPYNGDVRRAAFHEVTRQAVSRALEQSKEVDERLTEAQVVRRVDDRWVAFHVGDVLRGLFYSSAPVATGRVQAPALNWVVTRYVQKDLYTHSYLTLDLSPQGLKVRIELPKELGKRELKKAFDGARAVAVSVRESRQELPPRPPFSTDDLLQTAALLLKMGVGEVMGVAQELFEAGLITYHRTSSVHVSDAGLGIARTYVEGRWGVAAFQPRTWGPEGAHECIRPTKPMDEDELKVAVEEGMIRLPMELRWPHYALYSLIFNRFMESQMPAAKVLRQAYELRMTPKWERGEVSVKGEVVTGVEDPGWTRMSQLQISPSLSQGQEMTCSVSGFRRSSEPGKGVLTEGSLVALMKKRGIGRPSTYASTVDRLRKHGYVMAVGKAGYLIPTEKGRKLNEVLEIAFPTLVSEETTRRLVEMMDGVGSGLYDYQEVLRKLHADVLGSCAAAKAILDGKIGSRGRSRVFVLLGPCPTQVNLGEMGFVALDSPICPRSPSATLEEERPGTRFAHLPTLSCG